MKFHQEPLEKLILNLNLKIFEENGEKYNLLKLILQIIKININ
jgi:hypothetical protein